jgi:hypothetical protein
MKRRDFFRQAGFGSAALVSLPRLHALTRRAGDANDDDGRAGFHFSCVSLARTVGGVVHRLQIGGCGAFDLAEAEGEEVTIISTVHPQFLKPSSAPERGRLGRF